MKPRLIPQIVCIAALLIAFLALAPQHGVVAQDAAGTTAGTLAKPSGAVPVPIPAGDVDRVEIPGQLEQVVREGDYPAQLAGSTGNVQPSRFGPQRNDPDEGIPEHAYSPFDEKLNREHPCPPGGCDFVPGSLVIKFDSALQLVARSRNQLTGESTLDSQLAAAGIKGLEPIFPEAEAPARNAVQVAPSGEVVAVPDLTRWYKATLSDKGANIYSAVEELAKLPGIAWVEPDYLRRTTSPPHSSNSPYLLQ